MTQLPPIPKLSQQTQDYLRARGYDGNKIYEANRLPDFAIPRTLTCTSSMLAHRQPHNSSRSCPWCGRPSHHQTERTLQYRFRTCYWHYFCYGLSASEGDRCHHATLHQISVYLHHYIIGLLWRRNLRDIKN